MRTKFFIILTALTLNLFFSISVKAEIVCASVFGDPKAVAATKFGNGYKDFVFQKKNLRLLVWNVHKYADKDLTKDFSTWGSSSDLVLFQEAIDRPDFVKELLKAEPDINWTLFRSFKTTDDGYTGVATASKVKPLSEDLILSEPTEPILGTHKTMIVSKFAIEGEAEPLLVANIHGINFVTNTEFKIHMRQLYEAIRDHKGRMIVAGDFNTWNPGRSNFLFGLMARLGLKRPKLYRDGFFDLDHVFLRGFQVSKIYDLTNVESSDHDPNLLDLDWL